MVLSKCLAKKNLLKFPNCLVKIHFVECAMISHKTSKPSIVAYPSGVGSVINSILVHKYGFVCELAVTDKLFYWIFNFINFFSI